MIYLVINVFFNSLILGVMLYILNCFHNTIPWDLCFIIGYIVSAGLSLVGYTSFSADIVKIFLPGRKMIGREMERIEPLFREVIERVNQTYKTNYSFEKFKLLATDDKLVNAAALGYRIVYVNGGSFNMLNDEQLKALLAHEMAHLYYRDSVRNVVMIFGSFGVKVVMWLYAIYKAIATGITLMGSQYKQDHVTLAGLFALVPLIIFLPVIFLNWLGNIVFNLLNLKISRKCEYKADAFVATLGLKQGMIETLEIIDSQSVTDNSFFGKLIATHPAPKLRIGALEDENIQKKKLGAKLMSKLFVDSKDKTLSGSSEFLRFIGLVLIVGILWCGYVYYEYKYTPVKTIINKSTHIMKQKYKANSSELSKKHHNSKTLQSI